MAVLYGPFGCSHGFRAHAIGIFIGGKLNHLSKSQLTLDFLNRFACLIRLELSQATICHLVVICHMSSFANSPILMQRIDKKKPGRYTPLYFGAASRISPSY